MHATVQQTLKHRQACLLLCILDDHLTCMASRCSFELWVQVLSTSLGYHFSGILP
jgi:hypothetical protein